MFSTFPTSIPFHDLSEVALFAIFTHGPKRYGAFPYAYHLAHVSGTASIYTDDQDIIDAGWTHDLSEDEGTTPTEIAAISNPRVARLSWAVSGFGDNRRERLLCVCEKIPEEPGSEILKMCDRKCNIERCLFDGNLSMLRVYAEVEHPILSRVFPVSHPLRDDLEALVEEARILLSSTSRKVSTPR